MHKHVRDGKKRPDLGSFEAIVCPFRTYHVSKNKVGRKRGIIGEIHFYRHSFMMGIITHEAGHAALSYARLKGWKVDSEDDWQLGQDEESFCWVLGNISRQIILGAARQWKFPSSGYTKGIKYT